MVKYVSRERLHVIGKNDSEQKTENRTTESPIEIPIENSPRKRRMKCQQTGNWKLLIKSSPNPHKKVEIDKESHTDRLHRVETIK